MATPARDIQRILLIRPSALGDVCRSVGVAVRLKRAFPNARLDWLVQTGFEDAIRHHPDVDAIVPFPRRQLGFKRLLRHESSRRELLKLIRRLRNSSARLDDEPTPPEPTASHTHDAAPSAPYDLVLDAQGLLRSALFARLTGAPIRLGDAAAREGATIFYTHRTDTSAHTHTVDVMHALADAAAASFAAASAPIASAAPPPADPLAALRLYTHPDDDAAALRLLTPNHELPGDPDAEPSPPFAVLAPTSRWPGKRWPAERFAAVARALLDERRRGAPLLERLAIVAADNERPQCDPIFAAFESEPRLVDLVGRTSIAQLMALVKLSRFVLANDSAALHIAVGFHRPLLGLFGPTRIDRVGPYRHEHDVIQPHPPPAGVSHKHESAGRDMMRRIDTNAVIAASLERLHAAADAAAAAAAAAPSAPRAPADPRHSEIAP